MWSYFWRIHKLKLDDFTRILKQQQNYLSELTGEEKEIVIAKYTEIADLVLSSGLLEIKEPKKPTKNAKVNR